MRLAVVFISIAAALPGQTAFEVASIKLAPPQQMGHISIHRSTDKGRLSFSGVSLEDLIGDAYRIAHRQISGPDWLDSTRFDIVAKIPEGVGHEKVPEMLQALLADRFALKLREDTKEMPVYALVVGKSGSKMKKMEGSGSGINSNSNKVRTHVSAKTTMAAFVDDLSVHLDRPVVDQTGLEGAYEFELEYASENVEAADAPSIFTAVQEQMGLKLTPTKAPVRLIVVDHVDKVPAEN